MPDDHAQQPIEPIPAESAVPLADEIAPIDPRDPLAAVISEPGWQAVGAGFIARKGRQPIHARNGAIRAGWVAARAASYADAVATAATIDGDDASIGVVVGDRGDGWGFIFFDGDGMRDPVTGEIIALGRRWLELLPSTFTEISRSKTGLHLLFWLEPDSFARVKAAVAEQKHPGESVDCVTGAIGGNMGGRRSKAEFYIGARYCALTGWRLPGTPPAPATIPAEIALQLVNEIAAAINAAKTMAEAIKKTEKATTLPSSTSPNPHSLPAAAYNWPDNELWAEILAVAETDAELRKRVIKLEFEDPTDRSQIAIDLGGAMKRAGFDFEKMDQALHEFELTAEWAFEKGDAKGGREIQRIWNRAFERTTVDPREVFKRANRAAFEDPARPVATLTASRVPFSILSLAELEQRPKQRDVIAGLVPEQRLVVIGGAPKTGKTHLAVSLAFSVASGVPFAGHAVGPAGASVLYWAGEGVGGLGARFAANGLHLGVSDRDNVRVITGPLCLGDPASVTAFITTVRAQGFRPKVVVIDTLARAMPGQDENSSRDMGTAVAGADLIKDAFGCTVIIVAHSGKDPAKGLRGSSALHGALDVAFRVDPAPGGLIAFTMTDSKESELAQPIFFELRKIADSVVPVVSSRASAIGPGGALPVPVGDDEILAFNTLKYTIANRRRASNGLEAGPPEAASNGLQDIPPNVFMASLARVAVTVAEWRAAFVDRHDGGQRRTKVQAFRRASKSLVDKGLVTITGDWAEVASIINPSLAQGFFSASGSADEGDE